MSPRSRTGRKLLKALLPLFLLGSLAVVGITIWVVYGITRPHTRPYLVTPEKFAQLSDRGLKATEETWSNPDGTGARGWLIRGRAGAPAVVLLHRYGADRSWLLNLGVKLNETTDATVLLPDLRGHGENPPSNVTSFGVKETGDVLAAITHLKGLQTTQGQPLVGGPVGLYGVEVGAYAALSASAEDKEVVALVLDSVPESPGAAADSAVQTATGFDNALLKRLARLGLQAQHRGDFRNVPACEVARGSGAGSVLLVSGPDAGHLRASTVALANCFPPSSEVTLLDSLPLTGNNLPSASPEQGETYDRLVIEFFSKALADD